jgi:molecular chaperone GrpE (heat shock protein)
MEWVPVIVALIGAGALRYVEHIVRGLLQRRQAATPEGREAATVAAVSTSLAVVASARDELAEDNRRLRVMLSEERTRRAEDNAQHAAKEAGMRAEIDALEAKVRAVLAEFEDFRRRHRDDL